jgi:hypothetical protein
MKKIKTIVLACLLTGILGLKAGSQTLSSVINETISFLQGKATPANTVRSVHIEFSLVDNFGDLGIISGRTYLSVDSGNQVIGTKTLKKFFLKGSSSQWNNTNGSASNKSFTFTTPYMSAASSVLTIASNKGTFNNNVRADVPAIKTNNSSMFGTIPANEYIISGFIDPSNPKKYITIRIVQEFIPFG